MPDEIYVSPGDATGDAIQVNGVWYVRANLSEESPTFDSDDVEDMCCCIPFGENPGDVYQVLTPNTTGFGPVQFQP